MNYTLFHKIDEQFENAFNRQIELDNFQKSFILCRLGLFFCFALILLDWVRYKNGILFSSWVYEMLMATHLVLAFCVIPIWYIRRLRATKREISLLVMKRVTWTTLGILYLSVLPMAILSIYNRGTVITFGILILIANLVITFRHEERITLNLFCFITILTAIIVIQEGKAANLLVNTIEILGIMLPTFVFSTLQYNLNIDQYTNKRKIQEQKELLEKEQARSDELLLNILPAQVAAELKSYGKVTPRFHPQSTIMFVDFRNFTAICDALTPEALIADLNVLFGTFDQIIARHDLERIKTIGDAYMAFGGLREKGNAQAIAMIHSALDIQNFLKRWNTSRQKHQLPVFEARIGIHSGPVIAGVVGDQKLAFDIWGQPVNVAARMESACEPGQINISHQTFMLVQDEFDCHLRGKISVKNLGEHEMYYVKMNGTTGPIS